MAEEKLEKANFYGAEKLITGKGGAAGGSGGGGMGLTGGAYVPAEGGITSTNRWLRFDFNDPNHKSLVILGGTSFTIGENIITIDETTSYNFSDYISEEGADYYVFINADGRVIASTIRTPVDGYMFIGQFHTLCNGVPANTTAQFPTAIATIGESVVLCDYFKNQDLDFANFYTKTIDANNTGSYYNFATCLHPLQGFNTMDILPESVWCLNFHPSCKNWDGMVYCNSGNFAVDIYLQSGYWENTRSEYGVVHANNNHWVNFKMSQMIVGKSLLNYNQYFQMSIGSNQRTNIQGSIDQSTVGGHIDTSGRRMISFIGCEECCGYLSTELCDPVYINDGSGGGNIDGRGLMGTSYDSGGIAAAIGGDWDSGGYSGSAAYAVAPWIYSGPECGARGCCDISIV